jgi:hypothetical protein
MSDPDFPEELRSFIREMIPTIDAAELLVMLALNSERAYSVQEAVEAMQPTAVTAPAARRYLMHFHAQGLVAPRDGEAYQYSPGSPELDEAVRALARVYNARPVTLVRMIYAPKDEKIRSFADAFRIKK